MKSILSDSPARASTKIVHDSSTCSSGIKASHPALVQTSLRYAHCDLCDVHRHLARS
jgi:hypothetical protein